MATRGTRTADHGPTDCTRVVAKCPAPGSGATKARRPPAVSARRDTTRWPIGTPCSVTPRRQRASDPPRSHGRAAFLPPGHLTTAPRTAHAQMDTAAHQNRDATARQRQRGPETYGRDPTGGMACVGTAALHQRAARERGMSCGQMATHADSDRYACIFDP
jgi:hypothetical protein